MIKLIDTIKKVFTIKFLLLITAIALFVISVNFTFQSIKKNKIEIREENRIKFSQTKEKKTKIEAINLSKSKNANLDFWFEIFCRSILSSILSKESLESF